MGDLGSRIRGRIEVAGTGVIRTVTAIILTSTRSIQALWLCQPATSTGPNHPPRDAARSTIADDVVPCHSSFVSSCAPRTAESEWPADLSKVSFISQFIVTEVPKATITSAALRDMASACGPADVDLSTSAGNDRAH